MFKRFLKPVTALLAAALILAGSAGIFAASAYTDVAAGAWYENAVEYVSARKLMSGVTPTGFAPKTELSRAMTVLILAKEARADLSAYADAAPAFPDVEAGRWYTAAVAWATGCGVAAGTGGGFAPGRSVTRQELVLMMYRAARIFGFADAPATGPDTLDGFRDGDAVASWALEAVKWAVSRGYISGDTNSRLNPRGVATRAEAAQIFYRFDRAATVYAGGDSGVVRDGTPKKYFTICFDDGITQDEKIIEIFKKYNFTACTFYINTGLCGVSWPGVGLQYNRPDVTHVRFTMDRLEGGVYDGYDVEVHTLEHLSLKNYDNDIPALREQIDGDAVNIYNITGRFPVGMAWPGGPTEYTDTTVKLAAGNTCVNYARGIDSNGSFALPEEFMYWQPTCSITDPNVMFYLQKFVTETYDHDVLFFVWGHGYELDVHDKYGLLDELIRGVTEAAEDDASIALVTNAQFYQLFKDEIPSLK